MTDPSYPAEFGLPIEQFEELYDGIPARHKLVFMDACYAGDDARVQKYQKADEESRTKTVSLNFKGEESRSYKASSNDSSL